MNTCIPSHCLAIALPSFALKPTGNFDQTTTTFSHDTFQPYASVLGQVQKIVGQTINLLLKGENLLGGFSPCEQTMSSAKK